MLEVAPGKLQGRTNGAMRMEDELRQTTVGGVRNCPREVKQAIMAAIAEHLREHGPRDWSKIRERPEFVSYVGGPPGSAGERAFFRWKAAVTRELPRDETRPHEGRAVAGEQLAWASEQSRLSAEKLLHPPPPEFFMRKGADGLVSVDLLSALPDIWFDLQQVREDGFKAGGEGREVRSGKQVTDAAKVQLDLIERAVRLASEVYGLQQLRRRYEAIIRILDEVLAEVPHLHAKALDELARFNSAPSMLPTGGVTK